MIDGSSEREERGEDGEGGEEEGGVEDGEEEKEEVPSGHCEPVGDLEVPEINWFPDQEIAFHEVDEGDHPGTKGQSQIPGIDSAGSTGGGRGPHS